MEEGAELVVFLQVEVFFLGGGAPRSSGAELPPRPCSQLSGAAVCGFPFAGCRGTADPVSTTSVHEAGGFSSTTTTSAGVGPLRPAIGDFPSARGCSCSKVKESSSGGAPPTAPWTKTESSCSEEEHYISMLNFSWPQVACVTECPVRGSRVVFVSFCDRSKQIQKFAVCFPHLSDAESFLNSVKELSSSTMDIIPSGSDCVYEDSSSSESEYISSSGLQYRHDEVASFEEPTSDHRTAAPSFDYHEELSQSVLGSAPATNIDSSYSDFPHSYSVMPTGCSIKYEKDGDEPYPLTATGHAPERAYILDTCHDVAGKELIADKGKGAAKEIDASIQTFDMAGIETYVASDSFNDMLASLDKAIDELGGDMLF